MAHIMIMRPAVADSEMHVLLQTFFLHPSYFAFMQANCCPPSLVSKSIQQYPEWLIVETQWSWFHVGLGRRLVYVHVRFGSVQLISETSDKCDVRFFGQHDR